MSISRAIRAWLGVSSARSSARSGAEVAEEAVRARLAGRDDDPVAVQLGGDQPVPGPQERLARPLGGRPGPGRDLAERDRPAHRPGVLVERAEEHGPERIRGWRRGGPGARRPG